MALASLGLGLGYWFAWINLNRYQAEAVLIFREDLPKSGIVLNNLSMATALDLIKLPSNFETIKSTLGLDLSPETLRTMVEIPPPHDHSSMIQIISVSDNPNLSIEIANSLAKVSVKKAHALTQRQLEAELNKLTQMLDEANLKLAGDLKKIEQFKKSRQYFGMTADYSSLAVRAAEMRSKVHNATLHYNNLLAEYQNLKTEVANLPEEVEMRHPPSPSDPYQSHLVSLQARLSEAKAKYTPDNPKIKILQDELQDLLSQNSQHQSPEPLYERNATKDELQIELLRLGAKVRSALKTKQELAQSLVELEKELETLPSDQIAFSKLLNEKQLSEGQVHSLTEAIQGVQMMPPHGALEIYQHATQAKPLNDSRWITFFPFAGLFFGLLFGIATCRLLDRNRGS